MPVKPYEVVIEFIGGPFDGAEISYMGEYPGFVYHLTGRMFSGSLDAYLRCVYMDRVVDYVFAKRCGEKAFYYFSPRKGNSD